MNRGVLTAFAVLFVVVALAEPEIKSRDYSHIKPTPPTPPKHPRHPGEAEVEASNKPNKPSRHVKPQKSNPGLVKPRPAHPHLRHEVEAKTGKTKQKRRPAPIHRRPPHSGNPKPRPSTHTKPRPGKAKPRSPTHTKPRPNHAHKAKVAGSNKPNRPTKPHRPTPQPPKRPPIHTKA